MPPLDLDAPQLGEYVWHTFTADTTIPAESNAHRTYIEAAVAAHLPGFDWAGARVLELGAYRHFTGHLLATDRGAACFVTDISAAALRDGRTQAQKCGTEPRATLVVSDFHDLPFADHCFDVVFVASSVHHTRRPEVVLRERLRVVAPGGILVMANEPCARALCFHAFSCNRADSLTPFEAALNDAELLPTLSSPFWGARPENLFGMVENDRIPLSLYMETFGQFGEVMERKLAEDALIGPLERAVLALTGHGEALRAQVRSLLRAAVAEAEKRHGRTEQLLGYRLPTECDIHALTGTVATMIERRPVDDAVWQAEMFGAALSVVVRKNAGRLHASTSVFRREMEVESDKLVRDRHDSGALAAGLALPLLPDLHSSDAGAALEPWFPREDWQWERNDIGVRSLANLKAQSRVEIAPGDTRRLLLIRYYATVTDARPYWVRILCADRVLDEQLIVLQESRLVRAWVPEGCAEILVTITPMDDASMDMPWRIRIGVFQLFDAG